MRSITSVGCLAMTCGLASGSDINQNGDTVPISGFAVDDRRVMADSLGDIASFGYIYQVGSERVVIDGQPVATARAGEVRVYENYDGVFTISPDCSAVQLYAQLLPDDGVNPPVYQAWEGTGQFSANTVVDTINFTASALNEPPATAGDGVTDGVPFNDIVIILEEQENAIDSNFTPDLQRFGVVVTELAGADTPPPAGQVSVFGYTIDLTGDPNDPTDGIEFELADDDGVAAEGCIEATDFNPNVYLDSGITLAISPDANDSLHDVSFTMFFLQPVSDFSRAIDPQDASDRAQIVPQGFFTGVGYPFTVYNPLDQANTFPGAGGTPAGEATGSFDLIRVWDLTVPPAFLGADFTANPFDGEWLNEDGGANVGGGLRIAPTSRINFFADNPFLADDYGLDAFQIICDGFQITSLDGTTTVDITPKGGSEPAIGLYGPTPGTCGADEPCPADLAPPFGVIDLSDVDAFIVAFLAGDSAADLAPPTGVIDLSDVDTFIPLFLGGCP